MTRVIPRAGENALICTGLPVGLDRFFPPFSAGPIRGLQIFGGKKFGNIVDGSFWATQNRRSLVRNFFNCDFVAAILRPQFATAQIGAHLLFGPF